MKKSYAGISFLLVIMLYLSGCNTVGSKNLGLSAIYGAMAVLALLLLAGYLFAFKNKDKWILLLFSSVYIVNCGYFLLSVSSSLGYALMANRISYLGSVMLPLSMYMIIIKATNTSYNKKLPCLLFLISAVVFFITASPGYLPIYYKSVSFEIVNGTGMLIKEYGSWHSLYLFFLLGYFSAMIIAIVRATVKKTVSSNGHAVIIAIAVFVNIGVWLAEQLTKIDFEMLSVSYIISEFFLLGMSLVISENNKLKAKIGQSEEPVKNTITVSDSLKDNERIALFIEGTEKLTQTERKIYDAYTQRVTTKEIMEALSITENTLKFHNKNIYGKLGVSSRKELLEIYKQIT